MDFLESIKYYTKFFEILGYSPHHSSIILTRNQRRFWLREILQSLPSIAFVSNVCLFVILYFSSDVFQNCQISLRAMLITLVTVFFEFMRANAVLMHFVLYKHVFFEISEYFREFQIYFRKELNHYIPYRLLRKWLLIRFLMVIAPHAQYIIGYLVRIIKNREFFYTGIQSKLFQVMATLNYLHIIFYIELLSFHLKQLNDVIERDMGTIEIYDQFDTSRYIFLKNRIICYKLVHFRLWTVTKYINIVFGWTLVATLMLVMGDMIFTAYMFYEAVWRSAGFLRLLGIFISVF